MKTSNKLLLAIYLLVIVLILSSLVILIKNTKDYKSESKRKTLFIESEIDSLFLTVNGGANAKIIGGDSLLVKYIDYYNTKTIGKSLYVDVKSSAIVHIPKSVVYISVSADKCDLYDIKQDSLTLSAIGLKPSYIYNSKINHLKLILDSSKMGFTNTEINSLDVKMKNNSLLYNSKVSNE